MENSTVTASELGEYVYCKRAWWLKRTGKAGETSEMLQGILDHDLLANTLSSIRHNMTVVWIILLFGLGALLLVLTYFFTIR